MSVGMISFKDRLGRESLLRAPLLSLFRAPTDNDRGNGDAVRKLSEECDLVATNRISEAEKRTVIDSTFRARSKSFGVEEAKLDEDCRVYLSGLGTGQIIRLIDSALKKAAFENQLLITADTLKTISDQQKLGRNNRAFGYLGGAMHEKY